MALAQERSRSEELLDTLQKERAQWRFRENELLRQLNAASVNIVPRNVSIVKVAPSPPQELPPPPKFHNEDIPRLQSRITELTKKLAKYEADASKPTEKASSPRREPTLCYTTKVATFLRHLFLAIKEEEPHRCHEALQDRCVPALKALIPRGPDDDGALHNMAKVCGAIMRLCERATFGDADYSLNDIPKPSSLRADPTFQFTDVANVTRSQEISSSVNTSTRSEISYDDWKVQFLDAIRDSVLYD